MCVFGGGVWGQGGGGVQSKEKIEDNIPGLK